MKLKTFKISKVAVARVTSPLPIPTVCPHCGSAVERVSNSVIYRKEYGAWPFAYRCVSAPCDSYVGIHLKTDIPNGTLANKETRAARKLAHAAFDPIFDVHGVERTAAYAWLSGQMGLADVGACYIGWFGIDQCNLVVKICLANPKGPQ
jgi:hypothetical protein